MAPSRRRYELQRENPLILLVHKSHAVHPQVIDMFATTILSPNRHSNHKFPRRPPLLARLLLHFPRLDEFRVRNALVLYQYTNRRRLKINAPSRSNESVGKARVSKVFSRRNLSPKAHSASSSPVPRRKHHLRYPQHLNHQILDSYRGTTHHPLAQVALQLSRRWFHGDCMDHASAV